MNRKFKATFASKVTKACSVETDKYLSLASLDKLKPLMPKDISLADNPDLMALVFNLAVGNYANRNFDIISNETAVKIAKNFVWKYVDLNHERDVCVGVICNYGFSKYGSNEILTEEEALASKEPINLSLAALLWTPTLSNELVNLIEASSDESSPEYGNISASWELYFDEYDIAIGASKDLNECRVATAEEKDNLSKYLKMNDGPGKFGDEYVYTLISAGENKMLVSAGVGLVTSPAAMVKGVQVINPTVEAKVIETPEISTPKENCVSTNNNIHTMKYPFLKTISDATVHESVATAVDELVKSRLADAAAEWQAKLDASKAEETKVAQELESTATANKELVAKVSDLTDRLTTLANEVSAQKANDLLQARLASFDEKYTLTDAHRKILAARLQTVTDEASYASISEEYSLLFAPLLKGQAAAPTVTTPTISTASVKDAVENATPEVRVPNTQSIDSDKVDYASIAKRLAAQNTKSK